MRILVTGGAGYVGSVTVERLLEQGFEVTVFDNLTTGHADAVPKGATLVVGELGDEPALCAALDQARPEVVLHFAAHSLVGESVAKPFVYLRDNYVHGLTLAQRALERGARGFVLSSTASIYGSSAQTPIREDAPAAPDNPYGLSKFLLECALRGLCERSALSCIALRYFNAAGASKERGEDHEPETHLIPRVLRVAQGHEPSIGIFGGDYDTPDGTCIRDYVHVLDLADAHIAAARALGRQSFDCFNLGTGVGHSVLEVIETSRRITGKPIATEMRARRAGDPRALVASSERARAELGWQPTHDLDSIVDSAWAWMQKHPVGYAR